MTGSIVVADSSSLIGLLNIGRLKLLEKLFSQLFVPSKVAEEVGRGETDTSVWFAMQRSGFIRVMELPPDPRLPILLLQLDPGESEAILLADQLSLLLLIGEKSGRALATQMGIKITGLVGVLVALKRQGAILPEQMPVIMVELEVAGFRLGQSLQRL